ncbi:MAG: phage terminase small subunit-related protein [Carboxylicivirga sp.]|jgi:transposase-like protein|nr:phage terminase small subunit-related protein [Carboxylicivirga sp.]
MSKYDEKKKKAAGLYVKGTLTRKQVADTIGVTEKTLRKWIEEGNWDDLKEAKTVTRQQLLLDAYAQLKAVNRRIADMGNVPDKTLSDAKSQLRKEIETLSDSPLHQYAEIFDEFAVWLVHNNPDMAAEIAHLQLEFLNDMQHGDKDY